jgi:hypothetical protein
MVGYGVLVSDAQAPGLAKRFDQKVGLLRVERVVADGRRRRDGGGGFCHPAGVGFAL